MKRFFLPFITGMFVAYLYGCGNGPQVRVYISDPSQGGMEYYDEKTGKSGFVPYSETNGFVAFNEADAQALIDYCKLSQKP